MRNVSIFFGFVGTGVLVACSSATARGGRCATPLPQEFARVGTVYMACEVDRAAVPVAGRAAPPQGFTPSQACGSAVIEFVVDTTGRPLPDPVRVVTASDRRLAEAMRAELTMKRYTPATKDGVPVQQVARSEFRYSVSVSASGTPSSVARAAAPTC